MNFEKLLYLTTKYWDILPNQQAILIYIQYHHELLLWKKRKLKLGAIIFVTRQYKFDEFVLWEELEIKFINQDTTKEEEGKVETIFKKLGWERNARSYFSLAVVLILMLYKFIKTFRRFLFDIYPYAYIRDDKFDLVIKCGFELIFDFSSFKSFNSLSIINFWLIDVFTQFCIFYNVIF